ncbi:MAG TPA: hypothetical protein VHR66_00150 [Gemmataceae bacterium]|jgi:hypothetical protein|nr:hypothetical protein [Gemmataceae bacterium]
MPSSDTSDRDSELLTPAATVVDCFDIVLFELPNNRVAAFAAAAWRLTAKPLQWHWLPLGDDASSRALVRLEAPPRLLVERLLDDSRGVMVAFVEQAPRVWVQLGFRLASSAIPQLSAGQMFLLRPGRRDVVPDSIFTDEVKSLPLLPGPSMLQSRPAPPLVQASLRLGRAIGLEPPRLWVIRDDALAQLTAYCRSLHQQLLARLAVAVTATPDGPCVVLRAISGRTTPPVFIGPAVGYMPLHGMTNVYLPAETRLYPVVRRDVLRAALGIQFERVYWLHPLERGQIRVESMPASAFTPLSDWVEFRVGTSTPLENTWSPSARWTPEPFVERPESARAETRPALELTAPEPAVKLPRLRTRVFNWMKKLRGARRTSLTARQIAVPLGEVNSNTQNPSDRLHLVRPELVRRAMARSQKLETEFFQSLKSPAVTAGKRPWAELAAVYGTLGNHADAALCWLNALWEQPRPSAEWAWAWLCSEAKSARPEVKVIDPAPWLASMPGPGTTRAMAAWVVWASSQATPPDVLNDRVAELQARLESHEHWLPMRAAWLARVALARVGRGDVLGLARTRDRLTDRLLAGGLSLELDTPSFLRFAGEDVRERFQEARRWLADRRELIHQWLGRRPEDAWVRGDPADGPGPLRRVGLEPDVANTRAYADLMIAWGLSRFAEHATAEAIRRKGLNGLQSDDPVHAILRDGFNFRIDQIRDGKPPRGPLPVSLEERIRGLASVPRYAVEKLRERSRILEPVVRVNGYAQVVHVDHAHRSPAELIAAAPADRLHDEIDRLIELEARQSAQSRLAPIILAALAREPDLADVTVDRVFDALPSTFNATWNDPSTQHQLIERSVLVAARRDRAEVVRELANRFLRLVDESPQWDMLDTLVEPIVRALRRVDMVAEANHLLEYVAERVRRAPLVGRTGTDRPDENLAGLRVLLPVAAGWYASGRDESAHAILDEARTALFAEATSIPDRTALAFAYAATLGQAPVRIALGRLEEMFQRLSGIRVGGTTNAYYSLYPLLLVETAVRTVVSENFALGPQGRAWLDADELAVRRRIRDDLKAGLAAQGL